MARRSGILLPVASLPSPYGIGDFGPSAYRFVDWLAQSGQRVWEVLPLLIPDEHGSPYASPSAFAINWMFVSPEKLVEQKRLTRTIVKRFKKTRSRVQYAKTNVEKRSLIGYAWWAFRTTAKKPERRRFAAFRQSERWWLNDYASFMAIKDRYSGKPWWRWPAVLRDRKPHALREWKHTHRDEIAYFCFGQWIAHEQWQTLKRYANKKNIRILGDLPFFITRDSVDAWTDPSRVLLDSQRQLQWVSGAPPDYFQANGQIWGDPLYRWQTLKRKKFPWWLKRISKALSDYNEVRLDHFRGYEAVWAVPSSAVTAREGHWQKTPGSELFRRVRSRWPQEKFIAEDLGDITPEVLALRDHFHLLGMRILQFGYHKNVMREHNTDRYPLKSVAYSGTHDMPTLREWLGRATAAEREQLRTIGITTPQRLIDHLLASRSETVILPIADVLGLGAEAQINRPGIVDVKNWSWRLPRDLTNTALARKLKSRTRKYRR